MKLGGARAEGCMWLKNESSANIVFNRLKYKSMLSSPLKIRDYAKSSVEVTTEKELLDIMEERSQETARSFANEIKEMEIDKVLFLIFPFISDAFPEMFIKSNYEELAEELNVRQVWNFSAIIDHFKRDKIDIRNGKIRFSHPSYSEAIKYIIYDKRYKTTIAGEILRKVLLRLADNEETAKHAALFLYIHFDKLHGNIRDELLNLMNKHEYNAAKLSEVMIKIIQSCFDTISQNIREQVLLKLLDTKPDWDLIGFVVIPTEMGYISDHLQRTNFVNDLLNAGVYCEVFEIVNNNFDKISPRVRDEIVHKLGSKTHQRRGLCECIEKSFADAPHKVREEILLKLADTELRWCVFEIVNNNFDKISPRVRDAITLKEKEHRPKN
jgi:hypothetical protein